MSRCVQAAGKHTSSGRGASRSVPSWPRGRRTWNAFSAPFRHLCILRERGRAPRGRGGTGWPAGQHDSARSCPGPAALRRLLIHSTSALESRPWILPNFHERFTRFEIRFAVRTRGHTRTTHVPPQPCMAPHQRKDREGRLAWRAGGHAGACPARGGPFREDRKIKARQTILYLADMDQS